MKKIVLICYLVAMGIAGYAQTTIPAKKISKQDFETNVNQLQSLIAQNKQEDAKQKWTDLHNMMLSEFAELKLMIKAADDAHNEPDKANYMNVLKSQVSIYSEVVKYKNNLFSDKAALLSNLQRYNQSLL